MGTVCSTHGAEEECIRITFWWKIRKSPLGKPRSRWDDIKMSSQRQDGVWTGLF
jgi:hypothetical protein